MTKLKPIVIGCAYACFIIGNQWRDAQRLPRHP